MYAYVGGNWNHELQCGPFYVHLSVTESTAYTDNGAALSCKPLATA